MPQGARRKAIYEALHPETKQYVAGARATHIKLGRGDASANLALAFTAATAAATGMSKNLRRRHLDESQRAMIGARIASLQIGRPSENSANLRNTPTAEEAASTAAST